jgi:hypothetical protein
MAYLTFEFYPGVHISNFQPVWDDNVLESQTESGHKETASDDVRGRWIFKIGLSHITPEYYIYLVDFFHAHRGGALFYFKVPYGIAGIPEEGGTSIPGGDNPWDSEVEPGAGEGPTYLVRRVQRQFGAKKKFLDKGTPENYYETTEDLEFEQV